MPRRYRCKCYECGQLWPSRAVADLCADMDRRKAKEAKPSAS